MELEKKLFIEELEKYRENYKKNHLIEYEIGFLEAMEKYKNLILFGVGIELKEKIKDKILTLKKYLIEIEKDEDYKLRNYDNWLDGILYIKSKIEVLESL